MFAKTARTVCVVIVFLINSFLLSSISPWFLQSRIAYLLFPLVCYAYFCLLGWLCVNRWVLFVIFGFAGPVLGIAIYELCFIFM